MEFVKEIKEKVEKMNDEELEIELKNMEDYEDMYNGDIDEENMIFLEYLRIENEKRKFN